MGRGTGGFTNKAKKNTKRNFDANKLDYIQNNCKIPMVREETIFHEKFTTTKGVRIPDLIFNPKTLRKCVCEHDTYKVHGELSEPNAKTQKRNIDYVSANIPFFIIHQDLARLLKLDEAKLAEYLYYHTMMMKQAEFGASVRGLE